VFVTVALALLAPAADLSAEAKKVLKELEGDWVLVALANGGKERDTSGDTDRLRVTFAGAKFSLGKQLGEGEIVGLDPSTNPQIVDFVMRRKPASGHVNEAVFKVEKGTLAVVVYLGEGKKRPTGFGVPEDTDTWRFTFERAK
jgi:uncharacterized protein (TIGR03067 family)